MKDRLSLACLLALVIAPALPAQPPLALPELQAAANISRDVDGTPHILASNEHDLFFLQGWVHAEDRLFQMDLSRRQPSGTLAELLGPAALSSDVELRTIGLRRAAERSLPLLSDHTRAALEAYAEGVNAWVARHPLPPEYGALEITQFEPWTPTDSAVIGKLIAFGLSFDLDIDLTQALSTYQGAGPLAGIDGAALFSQDLFRSAPFDPASTVPDATGTAAASAASIDRSGAAPSSQLAALLRRGAATLRPETFELARRYLDRVSDLPAFQSALHPRERIEGSNEWAVAGSRTASGRPLLANDPHLSLGTPSTFYQIHLRAPRMGIDVIGSGFPGVPYVILGQNAYIAWGATTNPMDVTDTFQEQVVQDPASPSGLATVYLGQHEPILPLPQVFRYNQPGNGTPDDLATASPGGEVAGTIIPAVVLIVPRRNNGPIVSLDTNSGTALSIQYTGFSGTREIEAFRLWDRARSLHDFMEGLQFFDVGSQNWAFTDIDGNIAYFTSAEMPIREDLQAGHVDGLPPFFIRNGTGGNEWLPVEHPQPEQAVPYEILPMEEMPHVINPREGFFVNANNDPAGLTLDNDPLNQLRPGGGIYYLNPGYSFGTRAGRITQALRERFAAGPVTRADMKAIQADVTLLDAQVLVPYILAAFDHASASGADPALAALAADPRVAEAVGRLADWDFTTPTGIPEGYDASDVDGVRLPPSEQEIQDSIAATIYSEWRGRIVANAIDASLNPIAFPDPLGFPLPGSEQVMTALRHLLDTFDQNHGQGASGLEFFPVPGIADPATRRDVLLLQSLGEALDRLAGDGFADAFGGSTDQGDYRWGRLHRIVFSHPLGGPFSIPPAGGAFPPPLPDLPGIPTDGGFGVVDASSHSARADGTNGFMFGSGPVRRYVGEPGTRPGSIVGETSLPGGESGILGSPFYANVLPLWLTNDTHPVRYLFDDFNPTVVVRERFVPAPGGN